MGLNTTIVILNDQLHQLKTNGASFATQLYAAIQGRDFGPGRVAGVVVVASEHADTAQLVAVGGNTGRLLGVDRGLNSDVELLRKVAKDFGYDLRRRPR